jgi:hypothetical protein
MRLNSFLKISLALFLAISVCNAHSTYKVTFRLPNNSKELTLWADMGFSHVLMESAFECVPSTFCKINDPADKSDTYSGQAYIYKLATLSIIVNSRENAGAVQRDVTVRLTSLDFSVVGLNEATSLRSMILPNSLLSISFFTGELGFEHQDVSNLYPLDVFVLPDKSSTYYIKSKLSYRKLETSFSNKANVCFQDKEVKAQYDYFIAGDQKYVSDWDFFRAQIQFSHDDFTQYMFHLEPLTSDHGSFNVPYDQDLFLSYDQAPIKLYEKKQNEFCHLFVGNFFIQRTSLTMLLQPIENEKTKAYISVQIQPYDNYKGTPWAFIFFIGAFVAIFIVGSYLYGKKSGADDEEEVYEKYFVE